MISFKNLFSDFLQKILRLRTVLHFFSVKQQIPSETKTWSGYWETDEPMRHLTMSESEWR